MIIDRVGLGLLALGAAGIVSMLRPAREPAARPRHGFATCVARGATFEGTAHPAVAVASLLPRVELPAMTATPMRGMYQGWYGSELTDPAIAGGYHSPYGYLSAGVIGRDVHRSKLELNVSTIAPLPGSADGGSIWKVDLGPSTARVASLHYADVLAGVRCNEMLVRVVDADTETQVMCAVGASLKPSCVQLPLATSSSHLRVDIAANGTATVRGIEGTALVHRRFVVTFP